MGGAGLFWRFTLSSILTFQRYSFGALLAKMRCAPREMEAFLNMPLQDLRLTSFAALLLTLILAAVLLMQWDYITKRRIG